MKTPMLLFPDGVPTPPKEPTDNEPTEKDFEQLLEIDGFPINEPIDVEALLRIVEDSTPDITEDAGSFSDNDDDLENDQV